MRGVRVDRRRVQHCLGLLGAAVFIAGVAVVSVRRLEHVITEMTELGQRLERIRLQQARVVRLPRPRTPVGR